MRKIKVLYITAEISPYANAGGLGEVGRSFPEALYETGNYEVRRVMPLYKCITHKLNYITDFPVPMGQDYETCVVKKEKEKQKITTYFLENYRYFYRDNIYSYEDDGIRFFFFCKAVIELLKNLSFKPDIIHVNDWHTGFVPILVKKEFPKIKTVFTIHNISYHGFIPASYLQGYLTVEEIHKLGYPQWLNFMKAGITYSDLLTTVSPGYAKEIKKPENSCGMKNMIEERPNGMIGILNGIDTEYYNPSLEGELKYPYDVNSFDRKKKNRSLLREEYGLPDKDIPLLAMITRLENSKGIDILINALRFMDPRSYQLIVLGTGSPDYQNKLAEISIEYRNHMVVDFHYNTAVAKKIYAAADIYLMPSQFEPCGLGQLYALRYGAVPVVNPVGGLKDTVIDSEQVINNSTGFYMEEWSGKALARAVNRAILSYHSESWNYYIHNGMQYNSSWKQSVSEYTKYYVELLNVPKSIKSHN